MATTVSRAIPRDALRVEPTAKWIRGERGGRTLVSTRAALLVWEPGRIVPLYAFPDGDVDLAAFEPEPEPPARNGAAVAQSWALALDGQRVPHAAWRYADADLAGHVAVAWGACERWLEEDEEVVGHPADPFHRIDTRRSSRHVVVSLDGEVLAESRRPLLLFETGLPLRLYLPPADVRSELLEPSETQTVCAYKGVTSRYWSARVRGRLHEDVAWCYAQPLEQHREIAGLIAFFNERVEIDLDGERLEVPRTQWSR